MALAFALSGLNRLQKGPHFSSLAKRSTFFTLVPPMIYSVLSPGGIFGLFKILRARGVVRASPLTKKLVNIYVGIVKERALFKYECGVRDNF